MEKIFIVVAGGRVCEVLSKEPVDIEILDFDGCMGEDEENSLANYLESLVKDDLHTEVI